MPLKISDIEKYFGKIEYKSNPNGSVNITNGSFLINIISEPVAIIGLVRCHKKIYPFLNNIFIDIQKKNLQGSVDYADTKKNGGCFVPRHICWKTDKPLSTHSWGIAFDINPSTNKYGQKPSLNPKVVEIFEQYGFEWGGKWRTPDGMHFEFTKVNLLG